MIDTLEGIEREAEEALRTVQDESELGAWRSSYLGRRGKVTEAVKAVVTLPRQERP